MHMRPGPRQHESSSSAVRPSYTSDPGDSTRGPESYGSLSEEYNDALYGAGRVDEVDPDLEESEPSRQLSDGDTELADDSADVGGPTPASEPPAKSGGQIELSGARGVQIGDGNWQENFYIWTVETPPIDLAKRLESADVRRAVRALAADPTDRAARQDLVDKIAPERLLDAPTTTKLQVSQVGRRPGVIPSDSRLFGTLFLRELSGVQVGDGNIQRNEFTYAVAPTADAAGLLREHPKLAKALIDCAFPEKGSSDVAKVNAALRDALEHARVVPNDGIKRSRQHPMPAPGEVLRLSNIDGVSVGSGSTVRRADEITADQVTVAKPPQVSKAGRPPTFPDSPKLPS
jgi:hypothetical protein